MVFDPFGTTTKKKKRREPLVPALSPEEESSVLEQLGGGALSALGYVGESLDKALGGRAIRGVLGGKAREALSIIPFSDTLGITDFNDVVYGRELLEKAGIAPKNQPGLDPYDALGFGVDVLTDPLFYINPFAPWGKAGLIARAAGKAPKGIRAGMQGTLRSVAQQAAKEGPEELAKLTTAALGKKGKGFDLAAELAKPVGQSIVDEPLRSLGSFGLPFGPKMAFGTGETAQKIAGVLDVAGRAIKTVKPVRHLRGLFDPEVLGTTSKFQQPHAEDLSARLLKGEEASNREMVDVLRGFADQRLSLPPNAGALARHAIETGIIDPALAPVRSQIEAIQKLYGRQLPEQADLMLKSAALQPGKYNLMAQQFLAPGPQPLSAVDELMGTFGYGKRAVRGMGESQKMSRVQEIAARQPLGYAHRQPTIPPIGGIEVPEAAPIGGISLGDMKRMALKGGTQKVAPRDAHLLATGQSSQIARQEALRYLPTEELNPLTFDPVLSGPRRTAQRPRDARAYLQGLHPELLPAEVRELTDTLKNLNPWFAETKSPLFGHPVAMDTLKASREHQRATTAMQKVWEMLGDYAEPVKPSLESPAVEDVLKAMGADFSKVQAGMTPKALAEAAAKHGVEPMDFLKMGVHPEVAQFITKVTKAFKAPDEVAGLVGIIDKATNFFKTWATTRLGFQPRNLYSGQINNWFHGQFDAGDVAAAHRLLTKGAPIKGLSKATRYAGMTDEQATKAFADDVFAHGLFVPHQARDIGELLASAPVEKMGSEIPGLFPTPLREIGKTLIPKPKSKAGVSMLEQVNPFRTRGVGANEDVNVIARASRMAGRHVEGLNRIAPFLTLIKQGMDPAIARMKVLAAQGDYEALSAFERNVMRRMMPFYTYTRRITPEIIKNLLEHPSGAQRQTIRALDTARREGGFIPEHLGGGTYIPLGGREGINQAAITQLDIPSEQLNVLFNPGGVKKTGLGWLGMMNPLVKTPLEMFTGKQFFTDRELVDLEGRMGRLGTTAGILKHPKQVPYWAEELASNAPLVSGLLTRAGTLTDERKSVLSKAVNTLTGVKVSTTDMEKAQEQRVRNLIEERLRGQPGVSVFERLFVSPENMSQLSPEDLLLYQLHQTMQRRAQNRNREAKKLEKK